MVDVEMEESALTTAMLVSFLAFWHLAFTCLRTLSAIARHA
jgi:Fe2+ transport system protein B